ncbi:hypothetical protein V502_02525, partial [Pseudogymnoascus sp. VKM F-4520 (FW-2644)]
SNVFLRNGALDDLQPRAPGLDMNAIYYFYVNVPKDAGEGVTDKRGQPKCQLIDDIKEQWAHDKEQQENLQKVLADGALKHETTNWLKRAEWIAYFKERDLSKIHTCSYMPGQEDDYLCRRAAAMDRLFFGRCIDGLKSMPLMTWLLLASPHQLDAHSQLFGPLQEKTSMDCNLIYWTRFLCYCLNVLHLEDAELFEKHGFHFVAGQRESLETLAYVCWRALLGEWAIPTKDWPGMEDLGERFAEVQDAWLCKATYSPMGYTLSLLLYIQAIAKQTGSCLMSIVADMTADAEDLLWNVLMFKEGDNVRFKIPLADIEDDLMHTQQGKSFIYSNSLAGKEVEMLEDLVNRQQRQEFLNKNGQWNWGHEITSLRLVNGINWDWNGFVIDSEMVLVTQYNKTLSYFNLPKVILRFLPEQIGQLMAMYMIYIWPLTDHRKLAHNRGVKKADFENDDDDNNSEQYEILDDLAASHTTKTAENYSVTIDVLKRLTAESLEIFSQPKILPLNKAVSEVASEQALLKALQAVLQDDYAQF